MAGAGEPAHVGADIALLFPGDDRVFHANLTQVPESSTAGMLALGLVAMVRRGKVLD